jgi:hypothetical protein
MTEVLLTDDHRVAYADLHCHSDFTFLNGASHPEQLVEQTARLVHRDLESMDEPSHRDAFSQTKNEPGQSDQSDAESSRHGLTCQWTLTL